MNLEQKIATNTWDHIDGVLKVLELARAGKWNWGANSQCKYIEVRIDMRDGGCILKDHEGNRIDLETLQRQSHEASGFTWREMQDVLGTGSQEGGGAQ